MCPSMHREHLDRLVDDLNAVVAAEIHCGVSWPERLRQQKPSGFLGLLALVDAMDAQKIYTGGFG